MLDVRIVKETSPEANWNRRTGKQTGRQADRKTDLCVGWLRLQKIKIGQHQLKKCPESVKIQKCQEGVCNAQNQSEMFEKQYKNT